MSAMLQRIYGMNLGILCLLLLVVPIVWAKGCLWLRRNVQIRLNLLLLAAAVLAIGRITVWSRTPGEYAVVLRPLAALQAARQEPELYREMLMNVVLFLPLGLALSQVLPQKWPCWERVLLTIFVGGALSAAVEYTQYRFALGMAETDDVFCNGFFGKKFKNLLPIMMILASKGIKKLFRASFSDCASSKNRRKRY